MGLLASGANDSEVGTIRMSGPVSCLVRTVVPVEVHESYESTRRLEVARSMRRPSSLTGPVPVRMFVIHPEPVASGPVKDMVLPATVPV
jgi:hypothetical protein